ncbi:MAG: nickel insertion protein [[Clostridium] scindens]
MHRPVLYEGCGTIRCQQLRILRVAGAGGCEYPVSGEHIIADTGITESRGRFVTPSGAAIVAAIRTSKVLPEVFSVRKIGMGAEEESTTEPGILKSRCFD